MASLVPRNWASNNGDDGFKGIEIEVSEIDSAILMSLLEESLGEERGDDDRLNSLIRSLEEEIVNPNKVDGHDLIMEPELVPNDENSQLCNNNIVGNIDGHDWLVSHSHDHLGLGSWVNMEPMPSSPSDEDMNWYMVMEPCENEIEFGGFTDYSYNINYGVALEEQECNRSLWQQTYDTIMYD